MCSKCHGDIFHYNFLFFGFLHRCSVVMCSIQYILQCILRWILRNSVCVAPSATFITESYINIVIIRNSQSQIVRQCFRNKCCRGRHEKLNSKMCSLFTSEQYSYIASMSNNCMRCKCRFRFCLRGLKWTFWTTEYFQMKRLARQC